MDVQIVAIALGLVITLLFTEAFGLSTGGMIVPGYIALSLHKPLDVMLTLLVALSTYLLVLGVSKFAIIYGRRRIVLTVLTGFLLGSLVRATPAFAATGVDLAHPCPEALCCVIGFIIPGLIALWIERQGLWETMGPLMTSAVVVRLALILIGLEVLL